jgi:cell division protein FtsW (lipid II flippase)
MSTLQKLDRTPMQSKKFIAFFLCLVVSRISLIVMIKNDVGSTVLVTALLCSTFVDVGYILGQAALDIYVRGFSQLRRGKDETED